MKEKIEIILRENKARIAAGNTSGIAHHLHALFVQSQIDMLEGLVKLKSAQTSDEDDGYWEYIHLSDVENKITSLKQLL